MTAELMTTEEAAKYLTGQGVKRSAFTLRLYATMPGMGPNYLRMGCHTRWRIQDLQAWLKSYTKTIDARNPPAPKRRKPEPNKRLKQAYSTST
jgi:hypothetical protein